MIKIESRLEEFARLYNCEFTKEKFKVDGAYIGSKIPVTIMKFHLEYNETDIYANYEFGHQHMANFKFDLNSTRKIPEFIISTKNHFLRLFGFNKEIWKIQSEDHFTIAFLKDYLNKSGMTDLSKKAAFIPTITGKYQNGIFNCETVFHLGFDDKEESFKPNMDFQKILIDKLKEKYYS